MTRDRYLMRSYRQLGRYFMVLLLIGAVATVSAVVSGADSSVTLTTFALTVACAIMRVVVSVSELQAEVRELNAQLGQIASRVDWTANGRAHDDRR